MMCFPLGYIYFSSISRLKELNKSLFFVIVFSIFSSAVGYLFGIGKSFDYDISDEDTIGLLGSGGLYLAAMAIGILPLLLTTIKKSFWRGILFIGSLIVYIFILLNVRRTAIFIPVVGLLTYLWFTPNKTKIFRSIVIGVGILFLASPLYSDKLITRFEIREEQGRFDEDFYKTEGRYYESISVFTNTFSFSEPLKSFFGTNIYAGKTIIDGKEIRRGLHSDPAVLLDGCGIFGVFLYLIIYFSLFKFPLQYQAKDTKKQLYKTTYYSLLLMSILLSINGSLMLVSIRSILFLYLGATLALLSAREETNELTTVTK